MRFLLALWMTTIVTAAARAQPPTTGTAPGALPRPAEPAAPGVATPAPQEPAVAVPENLHTFDHRAVRLAWINRRWLLVHNGEPIKDFGSNERDARLALRLIHEYGLNQHGVVGSPQPVMEYWLSDGKPPRSLAAGGLRSLSVDPARLRVEQVNGQWCLRDGPQV